MFSILNESLNHITSPDWTTLYQWVTSIKTVNISSTITIRTEFSTSKRHRKCYAALDWESLRTRSDLHLSSWCLKYFLSAGQGAYQESFLWSVWGLRLFQWILETRLSPASKGPRRGVSARDVQWTTSSQRFLLFQMIINIFSPWVMGRLPRTALGNLKRLYSHDVSSLPGP